MYSSRWQAHSLHTPRKQGRKCITKAYLSYYKRLFKVVIVNMFFLICIYYVPMPFWGTNPVAQTVINNEIEETVNTRIKAGEINAKDTWKML
jgi:hypothetical protein